jgi:hypothetical protein
LFGKKKSPVERERSFGEAMERLKEIDKQLKHPTTGLSVLHVELAHGRLKILEAVQTGVMGLREENRELRRRQEKMLSDLGESRDEIHQVRLDIAQGLRGVPFPPDSAPPPREETTVDQPDSASGDADIPDATVHGPAAGPEFTGLDERHAASGDDHQEGTMDHNDDTHPDSTTPDARRAAEEQKLKRTIEAAYRGTPPPAAPAAAPAPAAPAVQTSDSESAHEDRNVAHGVLLMKAAGIASAELLVHRDTWEFVAAQAAGQPHFRTPPAVEDMKEGRVQAALSGRSLIAVLIALWETRATAPVLQADWALATTVYDRIAAELTGLTRTGRILRTIRVVLDDGLEQDTDPGPANDATPQEPPAA